MAKSSGAAASAKPTSHRIATSPATTNSASAPFSKTFVSLALLKLEEEGRINLQIPLAGRRARVR